MKNNEQNMQHTPGPWQPYLGNTRWCVETVACPATLTAIIYAGQDASCANSTEQGANARLIAAAPELLDIAARWLQWANGPVVPIAVRTALEADTRATIAKATGKV